MISSRVWYNPVLKAYNQYRFGEVLTEAHIISNETSIKVYDDYIEGFKLRRGLKTYFIRTEHIENLPMIVDETHKFSYKSEVLYIVTNGKSLKITPEKKMTFRELVDDFLPFKHTVPDHWTLLKIIGIASYIRRLNTRIVTEQGFGKDSVINGIIDITNSGANIYKATFPKLEYELRNHLIAFNEISTAKKDDRDNFEQFFLACGAFQNWYVKSSRSTVGTKERYDISSTSLILLQNTPKYYIDSGKEVFEQQFTRAVYYRFLPFLFEGSLTEDFDNNIDADTIAIENDDFYISWLKTLNWYRDNYTEPSFDRVLFSENEKRFEINYNTILSFIKEYAGDDETLYSRLSKSLYMTYDKYILEVKELELIY